MAIDRDAQQPQRRPASGAPAEPGASSRRAEALAASPETAAEEAERDMPPMGTGEARTESLATNPDAGADAPLPMQPGAPRFERRSAMSSGKDRGKHDGRKDESGRAGHGRSGELGPSGQPPSEPRGPKDAEAATDSREERAGAPPSPMGRPAVRRE